MASSSAADGHPNLIVAIDGPSGSGKGTLARRLANHYSFNYLDTGRLYRLIAKRALELDYPNSANALNVATSRPISSDELSDPDLGSSTLSMIVPLVASDRNVRSTLKKFQMSWLEHNRPYGAILDGRDIGTVICPDADVKLWVDAAPEERARRRHAELVGRGEAISPEDVLAQIAERDARDASRADAPARRADDAHLLDTTSLSIDAAFEEARRIVDAALQGRGP